MRSTLRSLKMIIVDEVSMVSSLNLVYMYLRLEELFGGHDWFGGRNVLFVGDLLQLQPVNGSPVFEKISRKSVCHKLGCATSVNIRTDSVVYDELTINERQKKDEEFSKMLDCVRRGAPTEDTLHTLQQSVIDVSVPGVICVAHYSHKTHLSHVYHFTIVSIASHEDRIDSNSHIGLSNSDLKSSVAVTSNSVSGLHLLEHFHV